MTRRNLGALAHTARVLAFEALSVVIDGIIRAQKRVRGW